MADNKTSKSFDWKTALANMGVGLAEGTMSGLLGGETQETQKSPLPSSGVSPLEGGQIPTQPFPGGRIDITPEMRQSIAMALLGRK